MTYITALGNDPWGKYILKHLENEGIKTDLISINSNYPTGMMMKHQVETGDPMIYYYRQNSAFSHYDLENIKHIDFSEYDQLHITGIPLALSQNTKEASFELAKRAKENGVYVSYDPNLRIQLWPNQQTMIETTIQMAKFCDMILPGINEGEILMGSKEPRQIADYFINLGVKEVVIKLGKEGGYYQNNQTSQIVSGFKVEKVVDTVGTGDGFAVGIISARLEGLNYEEILIRANAIGALQVQTLGDNEGLPTPQILRDYIKLR